MEAKKSKKGPNYSYLNNVRFFYKLQWKYSKGSLLLLLLGVPISLGLSYSNAYMPKLVIQQVTDVEGFWAIFIPILILAIFILLMQLLQELFTTMNFALLAKYNNALLNLKAEKCLTTDYENIESPRFRALMQRAGEALMGSNAGSPVNQMSQGSIALLTSILGYLLFGTVLSFANPLIALLLTLLPMLNYGILRSIQRYQYDSKDETTPLDRKLWYIATHAEDYRSAKDIRIYGMNTWLIHMFKYFTKERLKWDLILSKKYFLAQLIEGLIILLRDGFAYVILIRMVVRQEISVDNFALYFASVGAFTGMVGSIIGQISSQHTIHLITSDLRDFLTYPETFHRSPTDPAKLTEAIKHPSIDIKHVAYAYPEATQKAIDDVSYHIKQGEKLAIVGLNGAGKTTLIKMLCGLYHPQEGTIRVNDLELRDYSIEDYYKLFSVLFQDQHFMPISIAETVAATSSDKLDRDRVIAALDEAGLGEKIASLSHGIDSLLNKQLNHDGIELSGGEYQKLLLARAIYKDAPIIILDEPTAALDPISENELYLKYNTLFKDKTIIFISHRLSSTSFCDHILLLQDGQVLESGTHEELLAMDKTYAKLYNLQKKYYVIEEGIVS